METETTASSSKLILWIIGILIVAGVVFAVTQNNKEENRPTPELSAEGGAFSGDIFSLVAQDGDWRCTWSSSDQGVSITGAVFVSRGKFRSDAEIEGNGMSVVAHAIGDGEYVYSWTDLVPTGIKFPVSRSAEESLAVSGTNAQMEQFAKTYEYDCAPWDTAESGAFAIPTGITFTEVNGATN